MSITTVTQQLTVNNQLITPTDSLQYRAIGRLWGKYIPSSEQINQGKLITADGVIINAIVRKRASKRLRYPIDLSQDYLWTVYPRTPIEDSGIGFYMRLISVRTPSEYTDLMKTEFQLLADNFSVQGLVVYQDYEKGIVEVKIHRSPWMINDTPKGFKLRLFGFIPPKSVKCFWNFQVRRVGTDLVIQSGECIKYMADGAIKN
ncbi:hypothetical protein Cylst_6527 (plasmid) [Cylindrospermum stagnale PCC 7417]|uniref:Uncharacterized protein n=1 Tax=Cylindrospermum stagnale PCC 7417 TaxID=56107 RepID=K9X8A7_9NOST|nr:hypothetical protein [Cylindrospermum stagnale]AFZ28306.1 hypothetical protein Cylst_6527 [Cylindrospermum stagnale PCC 7417]